MYWCITWAIQFDLFIGQYHTQTTLKMRKRVVRTELACVAGGIVFARVRVFGGEGARKFKASPSNLWAASQFLCQNFARVK